MASTVFDPIAQGLADLISGIALSGGDTIKGIKWAPGETDTRPAGVIGMPTNERNRPEGPRGDKESQVGRTDWFVEFPVKFYFDRDPLARSQAQATEAAEAFIKAIDAACEVGGALNTLSGVMVHDAKVTSAEPVYWEPLAQSARPALGYDCTVSMFALV